MEKRIYNGTGMDIHIYPPLEDKIIGVIPSNGVLDVQSTSTTQFMNGNVPFVKKGNIVIDMLPTDYDIYIVSDRYAKAFVALGGDASLLYTPANAVYKDGKLKGYTRFESFNLFS